MGIQIDDDTLHSLLFADHQVIFAQHEDELRKSMDEYNKWGLEINFNKTECMCIGQDISHVEVNGIKIKSCNTFK